MTPGQRLRRQLTGLLLMVAVGAGYALWVNLTHLSIPCPFHAITGLQCPGCGVTRMCLALLRLDVSGAWSANPVLIYRKNTMNLVTKNIVKIDLSNC